MEGSKPNTNRFKKFRNTELTVILSLLFLSLVAAAYLFMSGDMQNRSEMDNSAQIEKSEVNMDPKEVKEAFNSLDSINNQIGETIRELQNEISEESSALEASEDVASEFDCWIVTGLFGEKANADKMIQKLESAGYTAESIERGNGALAVGIPANSENRDLLEKVRKDIAKDAYIFRKN